MAAGQSLLSKGSIARTDAISKPCSSNVEMIGWREFSCAQFKLDAYVQVQLLYFLGVMDEKIFC